MRAIILAAGIGSRLERLTNGQPKCLAEIGGRPLILHQLEALADHGVGPVLVVVGYNQAAIREVVGNRAEYLVNERFADTNSLYSLWLAREWVQGGFVLLNGDLFFHPNILSRVLEQSGNALAYDSTSSRGSEQTTVALRGRRVVDLGKDVPPRSARGESLGLLKFDEAGGQALFAAADHIVRVDGQEQAWVIEGTRATARAAVINAVNIAGLPWAEIDFPYDLEHARKEVWPAIQRGRWGRTRYWKRGRWAVVALAATVLAVAGWFASTRVGPASVDWESVAPNAAAAVTLQLADRTQTWWVLEGRDTLTAQIAGGAPLRLEMRLLMPPGADTTRYVVAVAIDRAPLLADAFTAEPDSSVQLPDAVVGDRDRIELVPPPGAKLLQVKLVWSSGATRLLVRLRQPE